jgi:hypothetical protein
MIDQEGKKIGAPVKASKFNNAVTLKKLQRTFALNQELREYDQENGSKTLRRVANKIDMTLPMSTDSYYSLKWFAKELLDRNIHLVIPALQQRPKRQRKTGGLATQPKPADDGHSIFYVDFDSRTVVRDTELGPEYTGEAILRRTGVDQDLRQLYLENRLELPKNIRSQALESGYPDTAETRALLFRLSPQHDEFVDRQSEEYQQQLRLGRYRGHSL